MNLPESTTVDEVFNIYYTAWELGLKGITIWRDNCQRQGILSTEHTKEEKISKEVSINTEDAKLQLEAKHKLQRGEIVKTGDYTLAENIENNGFNGTNKVSEKYNNE